MMTSLQKRLENVITEVSIIQEMLEKAGEKPPCCLTIHKDGKISCDSKEPMEKSRFLKECKVCRDNIVKTLNKKRICVIHGGITMVNKEVLLFRDLCSRVARELKEVRKDS